MPELSEAKLPKTINEALKILAYNDYFYTDSIKAPTTKLLPSSLDSISTLDNQSTLVPLIAMEREAHTNYKNDFHTFF